MSEITVVSTFDFFVELIILFLVADHFFISFFHNIELDLIGVYFLRGNIWVSLLSSFDAVIAHVSGNLSFLPCLLLSLSFKSNFGPEVLSLVMNLKSQRLNRLARTGLYERLACTVLTIQRAWF